MSDAEKPEDEHLEGNGPSWIPLEDPPPPPNWLNGHALPAVWRDTLPFTIGGLIAAEKQFPQMMPGAGWNPQPEPDSEADIEQAIAAKIHLGMRSLPILATAQLALVEPGDVEAIPDWEDEEELEHFARRARLARSPMFLDFEDIDGRPASWHEDGWPVPFDLRGALVWEHDSAIAAIAYGSLDGTHPWGGTDYQAWARWVFLRDSDSAWPAPGPGDFVARGSEVASWVDLEQESICAHHGAIAYNLIRRALRVLWALELLDVELVTPQLPRAERRRAARAGQSIGMVPAGLPRWSEVTAASAEDEPKPTSAVSPCPVSSTHARLNEAHAQWHEALDAYSDPVVFLGKLNALIQTLRNITFALQKELGPHPSLATEWYPGWQQRMRENRRLRWVVDARNKIVKEGDLEAHSKARVRIVGEFIRASTGEFDVDPATPVHEIARKINVGALGRRATAEGTLVVERRWIVDEFPDQELLEHLASCYGVLAELVEDTHEQLKVPMPSCERSAESPCDASPEGVARTGRLACMWAGREARTHRRDLSSGAPTVITSRTITRPPLDLDAIRRRYFDAPPEQPGADADVYERARVLHRHGRRILAADGRHIMIAWLSRDGVPLAQQTLWPESARDKYLMVEKLAAEATQLGANELILTAEAWEAPIVHREDPRASMRAGEREDRSEVLITHALRRDDDLETNRSAFTRTESGLVFADAETLTEYVDPLLQPVLDAWAEWERD